MQLKTIQARRRALGLTQAELHKLSSVSQSSIAKIERGSMSPSYEMAMKLFEALEQKENQVSVKAADIMSKHVYSIALKDTVNVGIKLMRSNGISQLPVVSNKRVVGLLSEAVLLDYVTQKGFLQWPVSKIMIEAPPQVSESTPLSILTELLKYCPLLIVQRQSNLIGVVAKSDLLAVGK